MDIIRTKMEDIKMTKTLTQKLKQKQQLKKGFTLIELIVVIAIIGVLAAMLVPSMIGYVNDSKEAKNDANARTVYTAAQAAYTSLNDMTLEGDQSSTETTKPYIQKVIKLVGNIEGTYTINIAQGQGVTKVVYSTSGTAPSTSASTSDATIGMYPKTTSPSKP